MRFTVNYSPFWKATSFLESEEQWNFAKPMLEKEETNWGSINNAHHFFDNQTLISKPLISRRDSKEGCYTSGSTINTPLPPRSSFSKTNWPSSYR